MAQAELVSIDVKAGAAAESQSGLAMLYPRIWGAFRRADNAKTALIVIHPTSNFLGHYILEPLAKRGIATLGLNTRYLGSDVTLLIERAIQDLGAGVKWLRQQGYERIVLLGNSGGGALVSLYQAQAENLTIKHTPAGDPIDLVPSDLVPADAIALSAAHLGRSPLMDLWIDPAVVDELDPGASVEELNIFNPDNGPPFSDEFLERYRVAQKARNRKIEVWARAKLKEVRSVQEGPGDMAFIIHRTLADPRCLDASIDPNDRSPGTTIWGSPFKQNYAANSFGRFTTLTAYLSQWSQSSNGNGPKNLAETSVPVLSVEHTADASVFPSDIEKWSRAAEGRLQTHRLIGGNHYLSGQPKLVEELADRLTAFCQAI